MQMIDQIRGFAGEYAALVLRTERLYGIPRATMNRVSRKGGPARRSSERFPHSITNKNYGA